MDIPSKYDPSAVEEKWYNFWMKKDLFHSVPDEREPYTIVIPPPNVTGVLHMGHMLNNTIQDVLVRRARMLGKNALWVPGTDHASIATEARVVAKLNEQGIEKKDLSREEFLSHAWDWTHKHGGIILEQLKKLGASCDWKRTKFTMDEDMSESVIRVFVDLFNKGHIYRGVRMVNWDPKAKTAVSDEEVIYREVKSKLYYVRYPVVGAKDHIVIATTRPETILGDTAVCVNPKDRRYKKYYGKKFIIPLVEREVPLILDEYVDMEFGTGALKITPAHDENDYNLGLKHNLESIDIFNDDGTLSPKSIWFTGEDRFVARDNIIRVLKEKGLLEKEEDYINKIGFSERTDAVIEPKLSLQWFLKMKDLSVPALENVINDNIRLYPSKFKNTYRHWMENVKDWCISRQLWWGHRIPAYFYGEGPNDFIVAVDVREALEMARLKSGNQELTFADLRQDEDVLDTWFSSWLWPISVFDGIRNPQNKDIDYYYPTNDLITAPEILFFWVARMIIAGYEYRGDKPFRNVYLTGIVRDQRRRKMSKSLGNSPDPLELIKKYSADGLRVGMLLCSPAGNDLLFDESLTEQGRNFGNKIWNAFRLVNLWEVDESLPQPESAKAAIRWFDAKLNQMMGIMESNYNKFRLSEVLMNVYKLFWDEFSSWYLEIVKPGHKQPIDKASYDSTIDFLDKLVHLLHPFMPFITEEIWHLIREGREDESLMISKVPVHSKYDAGVIRHFDEAKEVVTSVRMIRNEKNLPPRKILELYYQVSDGKYNTSLDTVICRLAGLSVIKRVEGRLEDAVSFMVKNIQYYIPLGELHNVEEELAKLGKELDYTRGFLDSVLKKLQNENFVQHAPKQVIDKEMAKKADAEKKIISLERQINELKK